MLLSTRPTFYLTHGNKWSDISPGITGVMKRKVIDVTDYLIATYIADITQSKQSFLKDLTHVTDEIIKPSLLLIC